MSADGTLEDYEFVVDLRKFQLGFVSQDGSAITIIPKIQGFITRDSAVIADTRACPTFDVIDCGVIPTGRGLLGRFKDQLERRLHPKGESIDKILQSGREMQCSHILQEHANEWKEAIVQSVETLTRANGSWSLSTADATQYFTQRQAFSDHNFFEIAAYDSSLRTHQPKFRNLDVPNLRWINPEDENTKTHIVLVKPALSLISDDSGKSIWSVYLDGDFKKNANTECLSFAEIIQPLESHFQRFAAGEITQEALTRLGTTFTSDNMRKWAYTLGHIGSWLEDEVGMNLSVYTISG